MLVIAGCAYLLVATGVPRSLRQPPEIEPQPRTCVDGLVDGRVTVTVGATTALPPAPVGASEQPSCGDFDTLAAGSRFGLDLFSTVAEAEPLCWEYDNEPVGPPPVAGALVVTATWSSEGILGYEIEAERTDEPGCSFAYVVQIDPSEDVPYDENNQQHIDLTSTPLTLVRTIRFPQVQFCSGAASQDTLGDFTCSDAWSVTIEAP